MKPPAIAAAITSPFTHFLANPFAFWLDDDLLKRFPSLYSTKLAFSTVGLELWFWQGNLADCIEVYMSIVLFMAC